MQQLISAKLVLKKEFYEGKRILIDFMENFSQEDCVFIGNTSKGFIPVVSENHETENYRARSFRFNVGALNQYILVSENEVRYIDELKQGDKILVLMGKEYKQFPIARIKKEIRPFVRLKFKSNDSEADVILQSNATVSILTENGIVDISKICEGDTVLMLPWGQASHLGAIKDEYCEEL